MKALGYLFHGCVQDAFEPHFILGEVGTPEHEALRIPVSETIISGMCNRGVFSMEDANVIVSKELSVTNISLCLQPQAYSKSRNAFLPISGFPRGLMSEDRNVQGKRSQPLGLFLRWGCPSTHACRQRKTPMADAGPCFS